MSLREAVRERLSAWGSHPVAEEWQAGRPRRSVGAPEFLALLESCKQIFHRAGMSEGQLVAVILDNSIDFFVAYLALLELGVLPCAIKREYRAIELDEIFSNAEPEFVLLEEDLLPAMSSRLHRRGLVMHGQAGFKSTPGELPARRPGRALPARAVSINYTYRGLGYPLGAMIPEESYLEGADALQDALQGRNGESMLVLLPLSHIFSLIGCLFVPILSGMTAILSNSLHPRPVLELARTRNIQFMTAVPELYTLYARFLADSPGIRLPFKTLVCGGSRLSESDYRFIGRAFRAELCQGYGLTEFAPVSRNFPGHTRPGTVGPVTHRIETRIAPDGEIQLCGRPLALGYLGRPTETTEAFDGGWFRTGDLGRFEDGHLVFVGEAKRTRKMNGNMVDLAEVERALRLHPRVIEARVEAAAPNFTAQVVLRCPIGGETEANPEAALKKFLKSIISSWKIPKMIQGVYEDGGEAFGQPG